MWYRRTNRWFKGRIVESVFSIVALGAAPLVSLGAGDASDAGAEGLFDRLDANGDGRLSKGELPERLRSYFERVDADRNGTVSTREFERVVQTIRRGTEAEQRGNPLQPSATMPRDVAWIPVRQGTSLEYLPLESDLAFGEPLTGADVDELLAAALIAEGVEHASPRIADDRFVRRVFLDLIGQLPAPADIEEYLADGSADRKARLIDRLLDMPQFGKTWSRYWRDVIAYRETAGANRLLPFAAEEWLADRFNENAGWDEITSAILTASGLSDETPEGFFFAAHDGEAPAVAGETARVFLGLQIACAECHDHPTDVWQRDQFHEFAAFFGSAAVRLRRDLGNGSRGPMIEIAAKPFRAEYRKPNLQDPSSEGEVVRPVFLSGQPIPAGANDLQRRGAAATFVTSKRNPYFAKAFVNRIWAELIGQGFTDPVDDLGTYQTVKYPELFDALARSFAASDYDIKDLFRTITNSRAYDRRFGELEASFEEEIAFRTVAPNRLAADQILDSLDWVLGGIDDGFPIFARQGVRRQFREIFGYDPSSDPGDIEGSIPQALALMNNPVLHGRLDADRPGNLLNKLLRTQSTDRDLVEMLYLRTLARKPSSEEVDKCLAYLREVGDRSEAFEDVLWALVNSTEFLNNH